MKLVTLNTLFEISYGNQFDLNKLDAFEDAEINFVSRSSKNLGVIAKVALYKDIEPFEELVHQVHAAAMVEPRILLA